MKNENIKRYIQDHFLSSKMKPEFAILVKGDWGCGKTFLVRDLILKDKFGQDYDTNVMYLSLYGLSDISQISKKIFELQHPLLTSKAAKFALSLTKAVTKNAIGVDLNQDGSTDLSFDFTVPELSTEIEGVKTQKVIVVDDLERCSIPMCEILGFFSEAIIEKSLPVIFIGDTKKLTEDTKFQKIKEKVIGMEFEVEPDIEEAVKSFVKELSLTDYSDIFEKTASEVLRNLNCSNLRAIRQAFFGINQILEILKKEFTDIDKDILSTLICSYLVIFIQRSTDSLNAQEITKAIKAYFIEYKSLKAYKEVHKNKTDILEYGLIHDPFITLYEKFIFKGIYDKNEIIDVYKKCITPPAEKTSYQKLMDSWIELSDVEFKICYEEVDSQIKNNEILKQGEILKIALLYCEFAHYKVIDCSVDDVKKSFFDYIEKNKDVILPSYDNYDTLDFTVRAEKYNKEYKELKDLLRKINGPLWAKKLKNKLNGLINDLPRHIDEFTYFIMYESNNMPLFVEVDITNFISQLQKLSFNEQNTVFNAFLYKYKDCNNGTIKKEYEVDVEQFSILVRQLQDSVEKTFMSPSNVRKQVIVKKYEQLLQWMKTRGDDK